jgi:rubrerythrin
MKILKALFGKSIEPVAKTELAVKQELRAVVIRACKSCGSAGVDSRGQDVGPVCPICGADRPANEDKGTIWRKYRHAS